jgi:hypothetical protein
MKETNLGDAVSKGMQIAEVLPVAISDLNLVNIHPLCNCGHRQHHRLFFQRGRGGLQRPSVAIENNSLATPAAMSRPSRASFRPTAFPNEFFFVHLAIQFLLVVLVSFD